MKTKLFSAALQNQDAATTGCRKYTPGRGSQRHIPITLSLLLGSLLALSANIGVADEDPPGCSLVNGGKGNTSSAGLNFNVATAHIGETIALFATAGMATNACSATEATGTIYISAGLLGNFLNNVTLFPGIILNCPTNGACVPGPYSVTITKEMIGAKVATPAGTVSGMPGYVRAVGDVTGHVHSGQYIEELAGFHTASVAIVDCAGALVLDPDHYAVKDECGVCGGDNSTCKDCAGVPNGDSKSNGTVCIKCVGSVDACGVCNGSSACLDCAGIPNGTTEVDCCGICGGDGTACKEKCTTYDLRKTKVNISRSLKSLLAMINKYSVQQSGCDSATKKAAANRIASAKILVARTNSLLKAYVDDTMTLCNTEFCVKTSLIDVLKTSKTNVRKLYNLSVQSQYAAGTACKVAQREGGKPGKSSTDLKNGLIGLGKIPPLHCVN